jgi:hypothetical protein
MIHNIFDNLEYRPFIRASAKKLGISYKALSTSARVHTSYFSRVMNMSADFSREQLYLIGSALRLKEEELEYLLLLGEFNNSGDPGHHAFLKNKIQGLQQEYGKLLKKFKNTSLELTQSDVDLYYRESVTAKIHMLLTINKYAESPSLLCKKIFISEQKLSDQLEKLENLKIIERYKNKVQVIKHTVHLDAAHPASIQNHINWRLETIQNLSLRKAVPSDYHLSAMFSCDQKTKNDIKELFKEFVVEAQNLVKQCRNTDDAFYIGMDLF